MSRRVTAPARVLMTADAVGGVWTYAIDAAHGLAAHGTRVTLAVPGPEPTRAQLARALRVPGLELVALPHPLDWTADDPADVEAAGVALAELAAQCGAELVQVNSAPLAAAGRYRVPLVVACHSCVATWWRAVRGDAPMPESFRWRTALAARAIARADAVLAPSASFARTTREAYGLDEPPVVARNGRRATPRAGGEPRPAASVLTAGRLWDEGKGVATLDAAAARLDVPVIAAGPLAGPAGAPARFERLRTTGALDAAAIAGLMAERPVFASPAVYEPFGLAVLEAAQAGCALVLSDIPTFRELWEGVAVFVPPRDPIAWADALGAVVADEGRRDFLGSSARERARRYTVEAMAGALLRAWAPALAGAAHAGGESAA